MNEPTRLADEQPDGFEAELILAARREAPSPELRGAIAMGAGLGGATALAPKASAAGTAWKATVLMATKGFVAGAIVTTALVGAPRLLPHRVTAPAASSAPRVATSLPGASDDVAATPSAGSAVSSSRQRASVSAPDEAPSASGRNKANARTAARGETRGPAAPAVAPPAVAVPADALGEEIGAFERARRALASGDVGTARVALTRYESAFPRGALALEAEVLRIEILEASGDPAAAQARARAFLDAHPAAPAARRLRSLLARGGRAPSP